MSAQSTNHNGMKKIEGKSPHVSSQPSSLAPAASPRLLYFRFTIYIPSIPKEITANDLKAYFRDANIDVLALKMMEQGPGRPCYSFVTLRSSKAAALLIQARWFSVKNVRLEVKQRKINYESKEAKARLKEEDQLLRHEMNGTAPTPATLSFSMSPAASAPSISSPTAWPVVAQSSTAKHTPAAGHTAVTVLPSEPKARPGESWARVLGGDDKAKKGGVATTAAPGVRPPASPARSASSPSTTAVITTTAVTTHSSSGFTPAKSPLLSSTVSSDGALMASVIDASRAGEDEPGLDEPSLENFDFHLDDDDDGLTTGSTGSGSGSGSTSGPSNASGSSTRQDSGSQFHASSPAATTPSQSQQSHQSSSGSHAFTPASASSSASPASHGGDDGDSGDMTHKAGSPSSSPSGRDGMGFGDVGSVMGMGMGMGMGMDMSIYPPHHFMKPSPHSLAHPASSSHLHHSHHHPHSMGMPHPMHGGHDGGSHGMGGLMGMDMGGLGMGMGQGGYGFGSTGEEEWVPMWRSEEVTTASSPPLSHEIPAVLYPAALPFVPTVVMAQTNGDVYEVMLDVLGRLVQTVTASQMHEGSRVRHTLRVEIGPSIEIQNSWASEGSGTWAHPFLRQDYSILVQLATGPETDVRFTPSLLGSSLLVIQVQLLPLPLTHFTPFPGASSHFAPPPHQQHQGSGGGSTPPHHLAHPHPSSHHHPHPHQHSGGGRAPSPGLSFLAPPFMSSSTSSSSSSSSSPSTAASSTSSSPATKHSNNNNNTSGGGRGGRNNKPASSPSRGPPPNLPIPASSSTSTSSSSSSTSSASAATVTPARSSSSSSAHSSVTSQSAASPSDAASDEEQ